jgi:hypothetical protein
MKHGWVELLGCAVLALSALAFATEGTFQGKVVDPPANEQASPGWIFIQGGNHMLRRVDVSHAVIVPPPGNSQHQHRKCGPDCLAVGQEVRVTAEQDGSGEWHAKRVEILRSAGGSNQGGERPIAVRSVAATSVGDAWSKPSTLRNLTGFQPCVLDNHVWLVVHPTLYGEVHIYPMVRRIMRDVL